MEMQLLLLLNFSHDSRTGAHSCHLLARNCVGMEIVSFFPDRINVRQIRHIKSAKRHFDLSCIPLFFNVASTRVV